VVVSSAFNIIRQSEGISPYSPSPLLKKLEAKALAARRLEITAREQQRSVLRELYLRTKTHRQWVIDAREPKKFDHLPLAFLTAVASCLSPQDLSSFSLVCQTTLKATTGALSEMLRHFCHNKTIQECCLDELGVNPGIVTSLNRQKLSAHFTILEREVRHRSDNFSDLILSSTSSLFHSFSLSSKATVFNKKRLKSFARIFKSAVLCKGIFSEMLQMIPSHVVDEKQVTDMLKSYENVASFVYQRSNMVITIPSREEIEIEYIKRPLISPEATSERQEFAILHSARKISEKAASEAGKKESCWMKKHGKSITAYTSYFFLPKEVIENCCSLHTLELCRFDQLNAHIIKNLCRLPNLKNLIIKDASPTCTVPSEICLLEQLEYLVFRSCPGISLLPLSLRNERHKELIITVNRACPLSEKTGTLPIKTHHLSHDCFYS
jgi:hypothetical protein